MGVRLDARASREWQAVAYAVRSIDKTLRKQIRTHTKRVAAPEWQKALARHATTELERRVIVATAVVAVSDQNVRIQAANKGRPVSGGFHPKVDGHAAEFGSNRRVVESRRVSARTRQHAIKAASGYSLRPRNRDGYVFWPAAREMVGRIFALWAQTTVRTVATALEGKTE